MWSTDSTLGELATANAVASRVFRRHRLDYCCAGGRSLREACEARGLAPEAVLAEIAREQPEAAEPAAAWETRPLSQLVEHILVRYHQPLLPELERLHYLAYKVERVHADKDDCPHGLAEHLGAMAEGLAEHLAKEEQVLFPALLAGGRGVQAHEPVQVMEREHTDHGRELARVRELTGDLRPPEGACNTWRALYLGLEALERELMEHIHLENHVLFPRALRA